MAILNRANLHSIFVELLGNNNVYFQPPASVKMKYPCIVYSKADIDNVHSNNKVYKQNRAYTVTVIDRNPDSEIAEKVSLLPYCSFDRSYASDGLNHDVFTIYY